MTHATARHLALLSTLACAALACDAVEPDVGDEASFRSTGRAQTLAPSSEGGMWINNGLDDPDVGGIDPAYALASEQGLATDHGLLLDPARRDAVRYLVECALPAGRSITKHVGGQALVFQGAIGLAPEWEDEACDQDCQEWVSACLLARTNVSGKTVSIWMRADHPAIGEGTHSSHPTHEASFFGNLFTDPPAQHYCQGTVVGPLVAQLEGRTCAGLTTESCGFTKHTDCPLVKRCTFPATGPLGASVGDSPKNCIVGPVSSGTAHHTISTYVGAL